MEAKIKKLKLKPIFEGKAVYENEDNGAKVLAVSIGSNVEVRKADGASALYIESTNVAPVRYNKVEEKDLELVTLQNELAGIVGGFDSSVHKLMAKYGYEWVDPNEGVAADPTPAMESVNEANSENPVGTWIGDFLVTDAVSINILVDVATNLYSFGDEQELENKFRSKIKELLKENFSEPMDSSSGMVDDAMENFVEEFANELTEFADYK